MRSFDDSSRIGGKMPGKMPRRFFRPSVFFLFFVVLAMLASPVFAQRGRTVTIRLASLAPENTPWGAALNQMAAEWAQVTNGAVEVIVFHNATAGNEQEVLRRLRVNQIQAAVFTSIGLNSIAPEVMAISYPFLIRDNEELDVVLNQLRPELERSIEQSGFVPLAWSRSGWLRIFSRSPVLTPEELRRQRMGANANEMELMQAFRLMGYQIVPVPTNVLISLNGGMVDAVNMSPIYAAASQAFGVARNMTNINVSPFMGGIFMNQTAWRRIPERYRPQLLEISRRMEREMDAAIMNLETQAINTMANHGLVIHDLTPAQRQLWFDEIARHENALVGPVNPVFNREFYQRISAILAAHRAGIAAGGGQ
ncbi:MAG: TRAP transporter substrate-binding protein DctP [Spirochaetes bacterium]|nr:TRAP transporter substrate-binding protein DctP [Spirochaetota bacterium]